MCPHELNELHRVLQVLLQSFKEGTWHITSWEWVVRVQPANGSDIDAMSGWTPIAEVGEVSHAGDRLANLQRTTSVRRTGGRGRAAAGAVESIPTVRHRQPKCRILEAERVPVDELLMSNRSTLLSALP
jgi:hypothetical protein